MKLFQAIKASLVNMTWEERGELTKGIFIGFIACLVCWIVIMLLILLAVTITRLILTCLFGVCPI